MGQKHSQYINQEFYLHLEVHLRHLRKLRDQHWFPIYGVKVEKFFSQTILAPQISIAP